MYSQKIAYFTLLTTQQNPHNKLVESPLGCLTVVRRKVFSNKIIIATPFRANTIIKLKWQQEEKEINFYCVSLFGIINNNDLSSFIVQT